MDLFICFSIMLTKIRVWAARKSWEKRYGKRENEDASNL